MEEKVKEKILIVDDEPDIVKLLSDFLTGLGYQVVAAYNGREGLEKARQDRPDLILLDYVMPEMDGYAFLDELRHDPQLLTIPTIMITVRDSYVDQIYAAVHATPDYLTKPFTLKQLQETVEKVLNRRRSP
ncbi:MAG: response regulator [Caldiserica bacterium]|nr:response regulator [Caldisericota bacterium]MDH7562712.1 response regulator [Caldisericota bacterium]